MAARLPITPRTAGAGGDTRSPIADAGRQIETAARFKLHQSSYPELWRLTCEYHEGIVTLRGHVSSFYMKQIAQTIARRVEGVERVVNRVEVVRTRYPR